MNIETQIWKAATKALVAGNRAVLLVVAESSGSSPGRKGFKLLVTEGDLIGSIGGGVMEVSLVNRARGILRSEIPDPKSQIVDLVHRANVPNPSGMICSGRQSVIICVLDKEDRDTVETIVSALENGIELNIVIDENGMRIRPPEGGTPSNRKSEAALFQYTEMLGRKPRLFVVGGGHCALALSELMSKIGFRIELFDDRAELNTLEKNSFADTKTIVDSYESIADHIPAGDDVYVVVMTLGYAFDEIVIRRLFDKDFRYFGVLGSKAKMKTLLNSLKKEGFDEGRLNRIRTPIGVPINSRTPEEIAVSIAAEIISVKNSD